MNAVDPLAQALRIHATAVVVNAHMDIGAECLGADANGTLARLTALFARVGRFDTVVDGVANQVDERVVECLDHLAIELGSLAGQHQCNLFARLAGKLAHKARQVCEDG